MRVLPLYAKNKCVCVCVCVNPREENGKPANGYTGINIHPLTHTHIQNTKIMSPMTFYEYASSSILTTGRHTIGHLTTDRS